MISSIMVVVVGGGGVGVGEELSTLLVLFFVLLANDVANMF